MVYKTNLDVLHLLVLSVDDWFIPDTNSVQVAYLAAHHIWSVTPLSILFGSILYVHFWKCKNSLNYCFCIQVSYLIVDDADMEMEMAKDPFLEARFYRTELIKNIFTTAK